MEIELNMDAEDVVLIISASLTWIISVAASLGTYYAVRKASFIQVRNQCDADLGYRRLLIIARPMLFRTSGLAQLRGSRQSSPIMIEETAVSQRQHPLIHP